MKRILCAFSVLLGLLSALAAPNNEKVVARIALLSDPHTNTKTEGKEAQYNVHFDKAIADINAAKVDFALIAGDLSNHGTAEEMQAFKKQTKKFKAPVWFVAGNHDVGHKFNSGKKEGTVTMEHVELYEKILGPSFFAKERSGVRVIGINASLFGSGFARENETWKFLEKQLAKPKAKPTILFMHYPLFLRTVDEPGGTYYNIEPEPRQRLLALIKQGGVKTVLTGHLHRSLVNRLDGILF